MESDGRCLSAYITFNVCWKIYQRSVDTPHIQRTSRSPFRLRQSMCSIIVYSTRPQVISHHIHAFCVPKIPADASVRKTLFAFSIYSSDRLNLYIHTHTHTSTTKRNFKGYQQSNVFISMCDMLTYIYIYIFIYIYIKGKHSEKAYIR